MEIIVNVCALLINAGLLFVAVKALTTWKDQKDHDLIIRALAQSEKAKGYISYLRHPISMDTDIHEKFRLEYEKVPKELNQAFYPNFIIASRRLNYEKILDEFSEIYEFCRARFKDEHVLTRYYKCIADIDRDVVNAANKYALTEKMIIEGSLQRKDYAKVIIDCREIIYGMGEDKISLKIKTIFDEVEKFRQNYH